MNKNHFLLKWQSLAFTKKIVKLLLSITILSCILSLHSFTAGNKSKTEKPAQAQSSKKGQSIAISNATKKQSKSNHIKAQRQNSIKLASNKQSQQKKSITNKRKALQNQAAKVDIKKLEKKYKMARSLSAKFTQIVEEPMLGRNKTSKGVLQISKPSKVRWETHKPRKSIIVSDGRVVWNYNPKGGLEGKGHASKFSASWIKNLPAFHILNGKISLVKEYKLLANKGKTLILKPIKLSSPFSQLQLKVNKEHLIEELLFQHKNLKKTKISLKNIRLSAKKIHGSQFDFHPPKGTEVVDSL